MQFKLVLVFMWCDLLLAVDQSLFYNPASKSFKLATPSQTLLTGSLANTIHTAFDLELTTSKRIHFRNEKVFLEVAESPNDNQVTCQSFHWNLSENNELIDCFDLNDHFWYGGSEMSDQQFWPINNQVGIIYSRLKFRQLIKTVASLTGDQLLRAICDGCLHKR